MQNHLPFWVGCITFVLFALVLEQVMYISPDEDVSSWNTIPGNGLASVSSWILRGAVLKEQALSSRHPWLRKSAETTGTRLCTARVTAASKLRFC